MLLKSNCRESLTFNFWNLEFFWDLSFGIYLEFVIWEFTPHSPIANWLVTVSQVRLTSSIR